jgi:hypothetical protein
MTAEISTHVDLTAGLNRTEFLDSAVCRNQNMHLIPLSVKAVIPAPDQFPWITAFLSDLTERSLTRQNLLTIFPTVGGQPALVQNIH